MTELAISEIAVCHNAVTAHLNSAAGIKHG
jgi:hypothetical protein